MGKKKVKAQDNKKKLRQFHIMTRKLHQMLQLLGECNQFNENIESLGSTVIKLDQFQKLRQAFTQAAQTYQSCNNQIKSVSDQVTRKMITFHTMESKKTMEDSLKQMTALSLKLKEKISKEKVRDEYKTPQKKKKKGGFSEVEDMMNDKLVENKQEQQVEKQQKSPQQKQLQYKTLVLYNLQRIYYKLIQTQRKEIVSVRKDLIKNHFAGLEQLKQEAQKRKLMEDIQHNQLTHEEQLEQDEILQAIRQLDDQIQMKMVPLLEDIDKMQSHAVGISQGIGQVHQKILINLDKVGQNEENLQKAQKLLEKVSPHAKKPSCICNVVLFFLLALCGFLLLKLFGVFDK